MLPQQQQHQLPHRVVANKPKFMATEPTFADRCTDSDSDSASSTTTSNTDRKGWDESIWIRGVMFQPTTALSSSMIPSYATDIALTWRAELVLLVKDLPTLMRGGFSWSAKNVVHKGGYVVVDEARLPPEFRAAGWTLVRRYQLMDCAELPQWNGNLYVFAREIGELARFEIDNLTPDHTHFVVAGKDKGQILYNFNRNFPNANFNALYDGMLLEGWWPWPKRRDIRGERAGEAEGEV